MESWYTYLCYRLHHCSELIALGWDSSHVGREQALVRYLENSGILLLRSLYTKSALEALRSKVNRCLLHRHSWQCYYFGLQYIIRLDRFISRILSFRTLNSDSIVMLEGRVASSVRRHYRLRFICFVVQWCWLRVGFQAWLAILVCMQWSRRLPELDIAQIDSNHCSREIESGEKANRSKLLVFWANSLKQETWEGLYRGLRALPTKH